MGSRRVRAPLALSSLPLLSAAAFAQEGPAPEETSQPALADAVLVTATRRAEPASAVPWFADAQDHLEFVVRRPRRTLADAIGELPSVMIQRTSYGQASPFVRGFTGYHTVLLVDGIRLNNSTFRSGPNQYFSTIDPLSTERVEVVRGPSSVLYGSDAVGGTLNAVARRRAVFDPGAHADVRVYERWASAERSFTTRAEVEGNLDDLGFLAGFDAKSYEDLMPGGSSHRLGQTGYREKAADFRADFRESPDSTWTAAFQWIEQTDVPRTHTTADSVSFHGTEVGDELRRDLSQERRLFYVRNRRVLESPVSDALEWTLSFHRQDESQARDRDASRSDLQGYRVDTWGFQVQAEKDTRFGLLTYGAELWRDDVDSFRRNFEDGVEVLETVQGPVADDAAYSLLGLYAQDAFRVGGADVTAGVRWTRAAADADRVDDPTVPGSDPATPGNVIGVDDSWRNLVGSVRAIRPVAEGWSVFGGLSQGFRAPNLSDLTRLDDTSGVETPSPDLDEETFLQAELGARASQACWSGQVAFWHTWIDDLIVPSPTGRLVGGTPEVRKDNVGDGSAQGVDAEVSVRVLDAWTFSGAATWQRGRVDQIATDGAIVRRPLSRMMPLTLVATAVYEEPGAGWRAWASARFADSQHELSLKDETDSERIPPGGTPGYGVLSFGMSVEVADGATLSLALENALDEEYRVHGSGVNEPGRSLVAALDLRF